MVAGLRRRHDGSHERAEWPHHPPRPPPPSPRPERAAPGSAPSRCATSSRLRRSATDRYVAGVAGGLGRHFDVDPTVVRVLLAVLTFFGGAGLLVDVAVWVLVPEDGQDHAAIELRSEMRRVVLIVAAVLAAIARLRRPVLR